MMVRNTRGFTLVEVLIGMVILVISSIAALSYFHYGLSGIRVEGNRRAATELARSRLDQLFAADFATIKPADNSTWWLTCSGTPCSWTLESTSTPESVSVNEVAGRQMLTMAQWIDDPAAAGTQNFLLLSAKVWFRPDLADTDRNRVELRTLRTAP